MRTRHSQRRDYAKVKRARVSVIAKRSMNASRCRAIIHRAWVVIITAQRAKCAIEIVPAFARSRVAEIFRAWVIIIAIFLGVYASDYATDWNAVISGAGVAIIAVSRKMKAPVLAKVSGAIIVIIAANGRERAYMIWRADIIGAVIAIIAVVIRLAAGE